MPKILGSPAFTTQNSLLVLTWDEGSEDDNRVATVFAGPAARKGFTSNAAYSHYSLLHTIEDVWGLTAPDRQRPQCAPHGRIAEPLAVSLFPANTQEPLPIMDPKLRSTAI